VKGRTSVVGWSYGFWYLTNCFMPSSCTLQTMFKYCHQLSHGRFRQSTTGSTKSWWSYPKNTTNAAALLPEAVAENLVSIGGQGAGRGAHPKKIKEDWLPFQVCCEIYRGKEGKRLKVFLHVGQKVIRRFRGSQVELELFVYDVGGYGDVSVPLADICTHWLLFYISNWPFPSF